MFELDRQIMPTQLSDNALDVILNQVRWKQTKPWLHV